MDAQAVRVETLTAILAASLVASLACGSASANSYTPEDASSSAQFREMAQVAVPILFQPRGTSEAYAPVYARYEALKSSLTLYRQKIDLAIVEADNEYHLTLIDVICADPEDEEKADRDALNIAIANSAMDRLEKLVADDAASPAE